MSGTAQLLTLFKGVIGMMKVRGYEVDMLDAIFTYTPEFFEKEFYRYSLQNPTPIQQFILEWDSKASLRSMLSTLFVHKANRDDQCVVYFTIPEEGGSVPVTESRNFADLLLKTKALSGIMISHNKLSPKAASSLAELSPNRSMFIQHYLDEDLLYDPLNSIWGSIPRILSDEEAKLFISKNGISPSQMPRITIEGPVAKYLGVRIGQIVEFVRESFIPESLVDSEIFHRVAYSRPAEKGKKR